MTYDITNFTTEVLEQSKHVPVLVDFWAAWCGPCRTLGPVLERLAEEEEAYAEPRWKLAKVNTEQYSEIAAQYGVRGIPNVKLFIDGNVVDEFTGALPEPAVRSWLEKTLPSPQADRLFEARRLLNEGETEQAEIILREIIEAEPGNQLARLTLAQRLLFNVPEEAQELVSDIHEDSDLFDQAQAIRVITTLEDYVNHPDALPEGSVKPLFLSAAEATTKGKFDEGLVLFINVIREERYYADDMSRRACVAIFKLLGESHEITRKHRRTFDGALYV